MLLIMLLYMQDSVYSVSSLTGMPNAYRVVYAPQRPLHQQILLSKKL